MDIAISAEGLAVEISRIYAAAPARVFTAWTQAESLIAWFAPTADMTVIVHELDVRVGGKYRIEMRSPKGTQYIAHGTYTEIAPSQRLAFTWAWEGKDEAPTMVILRFEPAGADRCQLTLRHERFATQAACDGHRQGWEASLPRLDATL